MSSGPPGVALASLRPSAALPNGGPGDSHRDESLPSRQRRGPATEARRCYEDIDVGEAAPGRRRGGREGALNCG